MLAAARPQIIVHELAEQIAEALGQAEPGTCDTAAIEKLIADHVRRTGTTRAATLAAQAAALPGRENFSTDLPFGHTDRVATEVWRDAIHVHGGESGMVEPAVVDALHDAGARDALTDAASLDHIDGGAVHDAELDADVTLCELAFKGWRLVRA